MARGFEPADDGPIARTDLAAVALAIAVDEGHADPALPIDDLGRDRLERPMMTHPGIAPLLVAVVVLFERGLRFIERRRAATRLYTRLVRVGAVHEPSPHGGLR